MHNKAHQQIRFSSILVCLLFALSLGFGQTSDRPADASPSVPALEKFHEVIYKIWHDAWPSKDVAMLQKLLPEIEKGIAEVAGAKLPGILREKKSAWDENIKKLQSIGADYKAAATAKDDAKLLAAAEKLHSQYEALGRVLRPVIKEIDDFHSSLYMLYHYYMPEKKTAQIKTSVAELKVKMVALSAAKLPEPMKSKEEAFGAAKTKLSKAVDDLEATLASKDEAKIKQAIETMHAAYESLNSLFQ